MSQALKHSHPIGPNTVNRTANLPVELDRALGRLAHQLNVSKSRLLRRAAAALVAGAIHARDLGLCLVVATGLWSVAWEAINPAFDNSKRIRGGRVTRRVRCRRDEFLFNPEEFNYE